MITYHIEGCLLCKNSWFTCVAFLITKLILISAVLFARVQNSSGQMVSWGAPHVFKGEPEAPLAFLPSFLFDLPSHIAIFPTAYFHYERDEWSLLASVSI